MMVSVGHRILIRHDAGSAMTVAISHRARQLTHAVHWTGLLAFLLALLWLALVSADYGDTSEFFL